MASIAENFPLVARQEASGKFAAIIAVNFPLAFRRRASGKLAAMPESPERAIARLAGAQRTIVGHAQLLAFGVGPDAISYRIRSGRLHVVFRGVSSVVSGPLPPLALELAALLATGQGSFVSHSSAAHVWGMVNRAPAEVEVSVVGREGKSRKGIRVHRLQAIDRREIQRHDGLWISTPTRALLEIAATATEDELIDAVGAAVTNRLVNRDQLDAILSRHRGSRGVARLAQVISEDTGAAISRSRAEKAMWKLIREARLPIPQVNQPLGPYVPDFMWPEQRVVVELDSYQFHAGPDRWRKDREKDLFYRERRFDVLRPTRYHVVHQPARVLVSLVRALQPAA